MDKAHEGKKPFLKKYSKLIIGLIVFVLFIIVFCFFILTSEKKPKPVPAPINPIGMEKARQIVKDILKNDPEKDSIEAFLYPEMIKPETKIASWDPGEPAKDADKYFYFAWIDRSPGNAFFAHPTEFVYIDPETGKYEKESREFWPVIGGNSFEGSKNTLIRVNEDSGKPVSFNLRTLSGIDISGLIPAAYAHPQAKYVHIEPQDPNFKHEDYAIIVAGYGKNSWVFLEGAQNMYKALKKQGYTDDHIYFSAQGGMDIDPEWAKKRIGDPKFKDVKGVVDERTSPNNFRRALEDVGRRMTEKDSLLIYVISHGSKKFLDIGRSLTEESLKDPNMTMDIAMYGHDDYVEADAFAKYSVANLKACEVMVLFDACYSGSLEPYLREAYAKSKIKRLQVAHSTDAETTSKGADFRDPLDTSITAVVDMDNKATETPTPDPNPKDHGGEFSSGIIDSLGSGIFSAAFNAGIKLDAANLNGLTHPYIWMLGESGKCNVLKTTTKKVPEPTTPPKAPEPEKPVTTQPKAETSQPEVTTPPKKMIKVIQYGSDYIPVSQLKVYSAKACNCCTEDHWHSISGSVKTVGGVTVPDPYKNCGFGTLKIKPVIEIEDPASK